MAILADNILINKENTSSYMLFVNLLCSFLTETGWSKNDLL